MNFLIQHDSEHLPGTAPYLLVSAKLEAMVQIIGTTHLSQYIQQIIVHKPFGEPQSGVVIFQSTDIGELAARIVFQSLSTTKIIFHSIPPTTQVSLIIHNTVISVLTIETT